MKTDLYIVKHAHSAEKTDILERSRNAHTVDLRSAFTGCAVTVEHDISARGLINVCEQIEDRGLARAVGTNKSCDLGASDNE